MVVWGTLSVVFAVASAAAGTLPVGEVKNSPVERPARLANTDPSLLRGVVIQRDDSPTKPDIYAAGLLVSVFYDDGWESLMPAGETPAPLMAPLKLPARAVADKRAAIAVTAQDGRFRLRHPGKPAVICLSDSLPDGPTTPTVSACLTMPAERSSGFVCLSQGAEGLLFCN